MRGTVLLILLFTAALLIPAAYAGQTYTITLKNGNTLTTNSYRLEGGKVYLTYPVGEVALPASEVASVSSGDGGVELLQIKGVLQPSAPVQSRETGPDVNTLQAGTGPGRDTGGRKAGLWGNEEPIEGRRERPAAIQRDAAHALPPGGTPNSSFGDLDAGYDPVADSLVEQLSTADKKQAEEITKKLSAIIWGADNGDDINKK